MLERKAHASEAGLEDHAHIQQQHQGEIRRIGSLPHEPQYAEVDQIRAQHNGCQQSHICHSLVIAPEQNDRQQGHMGQQDQQDQPEVGYSVFIHHALLFRRHRVVAPIRIRSFSWSRTEEIRLPFT